MRIVEKKNDVNLQILKCQRIYIITSLIKIIKGSENATNSIILYPENTLLIQID